MTYDLNDRNTNTCFQRGVGVSAGSINVRTWIRAYYFPVAATGRKLSRHAVPPLCTWEIIWYTLLEWMSAAFPGYPEIQHMYPPEAAGSDSD